MEKEVKKTLVLCTKNNFYELVHINISFKKLESDNIFFIDYWEIFNHRKVNKPIKWFNLDKNKYLTKVL